MISFDGSREKIDREKTEEIREILKRSLDKKGEKIFDDFKEGKKEELSLEDLEKFEERLYDEIKQSYGVEKAEDIVDRVKKVRLSIQLARLEKESKSKIVLRRRFEVLKDLGDVCLNLNELEGAKKHYEEMLSLSKTLGRGETVVSSLKSLAELYLFEGDIEKVKKKANEIIERGKELDDDVKRAEGIRLAGIAAWRKDNSQEALNYLKRALDLFKEEETTEKIATVQRDIGDIHIDEEDHEKGIEFYRKASEDYGEVGMIYERINLLQEIGMILSDTGEMERAIELFEKVEKEAGEHSLVNIKAWSILNSGELYIEEGDLTAGRKKLEKAVKMFEDQEDLYGEAGAKLAYGKALSKSGEEKEAERFLKRSVKLFDRLNILDSKTEGLYQLASAQKDLGEKEKARRNLEEALELSDSLNMGELKDEIVEKRERLTK